jgi:hypothetical protein
MTETTTVAAPPAGADADAGNSTGALSHDAYHRLDPSQQGDFAQVRKPDGDGSHWVRRADLEASATTTTQTRQRPAWVPEHAWDAQKGLDQTKFDAWYREKVAPAVARHEAEEARRAALPQKPTDYEVDTSPAFRLPPGDERMLDVNDPFWSKAKDWALKHGVSRDSFKQAVDLVVARDSITRAQVQRARDGELAKLGPAAQARMNAVEAIYTDLLGEADAKAMMARIWTAADVLRAEKVVAAFATRQGGSSPRQEPGISDDAYAAMDAGARYNYAKAHSGAPR